MKCVPHGGESSSLGGLEEINLSLLPYPPAMVPPAGPRNAAHNPVSRTSFGRCVMAMWMCNGDV
jgi:hypothetical protein